MMYDVGVMSLRSKRSILIIKNITAPEVFIILRIVQNYVQK